jgi:hypothetical protein
MAIPVLVVLSYSIVEVVNQTVNVLSADKAMRWITPIIPALCVRVLSEVAFPVREIPLILLSLVGLAMLSSISTLQIQCVTRVLWVMPPA